MTREEAIAFFKDMNECTYGNLEAVEMAIKALENEPRFLVHSDGKIEQIIEPCDDCVSRKAVNELLLKYAHSEEGKLFTEFLISQIKDLPSVLPKREQGEWILVRERLPKVDGSYRVIQKSGGYATYVFHKDGNSEEYWKRCAVAWMPIPKYEGVE